MSCSNEPAPAGESFLPLLTTSTGGAVARLEGSDTRIPMTPLDNPAHFAGVRHHPWDGEITQSFPDYRSHFGP